MTLWVAFGVFLLVVIAVAIWADRQGKAYRPEKPVGRHTRTDEFELVRVEAFEDVSYTLAERVETIEKLPPVP